MAGALHNPKGITLCSYSPLGTLRQAGLKLQTAKCNFCQPEERFLGHIISAKGVAADPDKTKVISNWPTPTDKRHVQHFLVLVNYYRRLIKNFSSIAKPLELRKTPLFSGAPCVKRQLMNSIKIGYSRQFILDTDGSVSGIVAVLSQYQDDGHECVIAYASRSLSRQEQQYCVTRSELPSCMFPKRGILTLHAFTLTVVPG